MATNGTVDEVVQHDLCGPSCANQCWTWDVEQIVMSSYILSQIKYAVLILNRPISQNQEFVKRIWNNATIRMTVDGGTKQWDAFLNTLSDDMRKSIKKPDLVTGDFDSITDEILEKYQKKGCKTIHTPNQNLTDFTKALMELNTHSNYEQLEISHVIAIAQTSGRLDQILGNIQTLFLVREKHLLSPHTQVYILSDDSISWLLYPGSHVINVPDDTRKYKRAWCSLIPIGAICQSVTSSGLKWNLNNQSLKFGDLVSTSNSFDGSEKVTVECSDTLLWSMKIPSVMGKDNQRRGNVS